MIVANQLSPRTHRALAPRWARPSRLLWILVGAISIACSLSSPSVAAPDDDPVEIAEARARTQVPRDVVMARAAVDAARHLLDEGRTAEADVQIQIALAHDPASVHAHLLRASRVGLDPGAALEAYRAVGRAAIQGFPNQLVLALNILLLTLWAISLGVVGTAGAIVFRYVRHVHHSLQESLKRRVGGSAAPLVAGFLLFVPLLWGVGLLPTLVFFILWFGHIMRRQERALAHGLVAVGAVLWVAHFWGPGPLAEPGPDHEPFRVAAALEAAAGSGYEDPMDFEEPAGYVDWARGMAAKRAGDLAAAEESLRQAANTLPRESGAAIDLANVQFARGDLNAAREAYERVIARSPGSAEAHYNLSQVLTEQLDLIRADQAMQEAMRLDYERITDFGDGPAVTLVRPAIDVLPSNWPFWLATLRGQGVSGHLSLPPGLGIVSPGGKIAFMPLGLLAMWLLGTLAGQWLQRTVTTYACESCGAIVCRRCLVRLDGAAYCADCGNTLSADCSAEYSKALLERYFRRRYTPRSILTTVVRWLLPGWAEVANWPIGRSIVVLTFASAALLAISLPELPVSGNPHGTAPALPQGLLIVAAVVMYAMSRLLTWRWQRAGADRELLDEDYASNAAA